MRQLLLALAIAAGAGCSADSAPGGDASAPASVAGAAATPAATPPSTPDAPPAPAPDQVATVPTRFQGKWALDAAACAFAAHESHLSIGADRIQFHESGGTVTSVSQNGSELTVVARLSGEGETREASYRFRLSEDGNTLTDLSSGAAMVRHRC